MAADEAVLIQQVPGTEGDVGYAGELAVGWSLFTMPERDGRRLFEIRWNGEAVLKLTGCTAEVIAQAPLEVLIGAANRCSADG